MITNFTTTPGVFQSKWGFHSCSYEDFKKIKKLYALYWEAKRARGTYERYWRKHPQNRVVRKLNGALLYNPIPMSEPFYPNVYDKLLKQPLVELYERARMPFAKENLVKPLPLSVSKVEALLAELELARVKQ